MRRTLVACLLGIASWLTANRAGAEPMVDIGTIAGETCVSEAELGASLRRSGLTVGENGSAPGAQVSVDVAGTPGELTVVVRRAGAESSERLAPATCETATDAVAAFVVSAVAPAPVVPVEPPATKPEEKLDVRAFERAVRDELFEREIRYQKRGITLTFSQDALRRYLVRIDKSHSPECTRTVVLGAVGELSDRELERITRRVVDAIRQAERCLPGTWQERARLRYLGDALDTVDRNQSYGLVSSGLLLATGSTWLIVLAVKDGSDWELGFSTRKSAFATSAGVFATAGGAAGLSLPEDYRQAAILSTAAASNGAFWAWLTEGEDAPQNRYAATAFFAGGMTTAGLITLNAALQRPRVGRLLVAHHEFKRRFPSSARTREVERDLRTLDPPIPNWVAHSPMIAAGIVGFVPGIVNGFDQYTSAPALGGLFVLAGGLRGFVPTPWDSYESDLEKAGLRELSLGPGPEGSVGLTFSGKF
jgi:hypothetical protein